ncbi:transposase [Sphingobium fontiphilum]|uniref:Transposase n=1 Tax=Sphingobium fontiphilum TaxID=944425 RepID=A0A7W6DK85_9SPHN|nr:transposase [Sphingobium fontiphilum]MBB3982200.1 transposase [Sphingobium fontiphilum]
MTLLDGQTGVAVLADKAHDGNALRALIADMRAKAAVPSNRARKLLIPHDAGIDKHRNRIARCFNRPEHLRRFATRHDRRTVHCDGFVPLAAAMVWLGGMAIGASVVDLKFATLSGQARSEFQILKPH